MKNLTRILSSLSLILLMAFNARSQDVYKAAPVGIGTMTPSQALDVAGNIKFSQALMPGNSPGTLGNILLSGGSNSAPAWLANGTSGQAIYSNGSATPLWAAYGYWSLTGNSGTNTTVNFLGTADDNQFRFRSNAVYAGSLDPQLVGATTFGNTYLGTQRPNNSFTQGAGNLDAGTYNVGFGQAALGNCGVNSYNIALGVMTMGANSSTGSYNIGLNWYALFFNDVGTGNIGIGYETLEDNGGTSSYNTVIGDEASIGPALYSGQNTTANTSNYWGNANSALGWGTLMFPTANANANSNTAMGYESELKTYGARNTAVGDSALVTNSTGSNNTALGYQANVATATLTNATAIGYQASAPVSNSIALGNASVAYNAITGAGFYLPGYSATGSLYYTSVNTGIVSSLTPGTSGYYLQSNGPGVAPTWASVSPTSGSVTSVIGTAPITIAPATTWVVGIQGSSSGTDIGGVLYSAGASSPASFTPTPTSAGLILTSSASGGAPTWTALASTPVWNLTGNSSTTPGTDFIGTTDLNRLVFKVDNVVSGTIDLPSPTGNENVYYGYNITTDAGSNNVAVGWEAASGSGSQNIYLGRQGTVDNASITGSNDIGIGYQTMENLTSGIDNVSAGSGAFGVESGSFNTGFGYSALDRSAGNFIGKYNTGIGQQTLNAGSVLLNSNTAVGYQSQGGTESSHNTSFGSGALEIFGASGGGIMTGTYNTAVGDSVYYINTGSPTWTGNYNTGLGCLAEAGAESGSGGFTNTTSIGARADANINNSLVLGSINGTNGATANTNVGIGTNTPGSDAALAIKTGHLETQGTISSVVLGSGAGTGGTPSASIGANGATDVGGEISITTGTTGLATGSQAAISFSNTYTYSPVIVISPANAAAATAMTVNGAYATSNTTGFNINFTSSPLTNTTYNFNYYAIETPGTSPVYVYPSYTETCVVPITITNGTTAIAPGTTQFNGYQQMISVNSSLYTNENASLNNIVFTTAAPVAGVTQGTVLEAWIESGATNSSNPTVYWVNLGTTGIAASGTLTIYMNIVTANVLSATGPTGEAPQLSGTYAQYDNGSLVFNNYWNFIGPSVPIGITEELNIANPATSSGGTITLNDGATLSINNWGTFLVTSSTISAGNVAETYFKQTTYPSEPSAGQALLGGIVASTSQTLVQNTLTSYAGTIDYQTGQTLQSPAGVTVPTSTFNYEMQSGYNQHNYPYAVLGYSNMGSTGNTSLNIWSLGINSSGNIGFADLNYTNLSTTYASGTAPNAKALSSFYIALQGTQGSIFYQWLRTRTYPPGGVMPTVAFSAESCP